MDINDELREIEKQNIESEEDIADFGDFEEYFGIDDLDEDGEIKELFF